MIIVCPDGDKTSWYMDSPIDSTSQYESYITRELVPVIDQKYRTIKQKHGRAITGLSMEVTGHFTSLFSEPRHMGSGRKYEWWCQYNSFAEEWNIDEILGPYAQYKKNWEANTVVNLTYLLNGDLKIIFDCGKEDFFADVNEELHEKLIIEGILHEYAVRPGKHNWDYGAVQ